MLTKQEVGILLRNKFGFSNIDLKDLCGYIDQIFLIIFENEKFVFKISQNPAMTERLFCQQIDLMDLLRQSGINIPEIVLTRNGERYFVIEGETNKICLMVRYSDGDNYSVNSSRDFEKFASFLASIHQICEKLCSDQEFYINPIKLIQEENNEIEDYTCKFEKLDFSRLYKIRKSIFLEYKNSTSDLSVALLVNDLHWSNIKYKNGKPSILDFNIAGRNYFVDEISWVIVWYFLKQNKIHLVSDFIENYQKVRKLNDKETKLLSILPILYFKLRLKEFRRLRSQDEIDKFTENVLTLQDQLSLCLE